MSTFLILFIIGNIIGGVIYKFIPKLNENLRLMSDKKLALENYALPVKEYSDDVKFLSKYSFKNCLSYYYHGDTTELSLEEIDADINTYKDSFINNILSQQEDITSNKPFYEAAKQIHILFSRKVSIYTSKSNFSVIHDLKHLLDFVSTLNIDIDSKYTIEAIKYEFLFNLLKDLFNFKKQLPIDSTHKRELIALFQDNKEKDILKECLKYSNICQAIKDKYKVKNLDLHFKSYSEVDTKINLIEKSIENTLKSEDNLNNLEFKVTANSIKKDILPKISEYRNQNSKDTLSEETLDKILLILDQNKISNKPSIEMELKIINRYLDTLNKDSIYV